MTGFLRIKTKIDNSEIDGDIQKTAKKLEVAEKEASMAADKVQDLIDKLDKLGYAGAKEVDLAPIRKQIDQATLGLDKANNKVEDLKGKLDKVDSKKIGNVAENMDKVTKKAKGTIKQMLNFGTSMLAFSSIFKMAMVYFEEHEEVANKLTSIWGVLAEMLSPIIETVVNLFAKGVAYLAVFIKALTGVDIIANRNARALKAQAKAQKSLNKEIASFDEITKQQDTQSQLDSTPDTTFKTPELDTNIIEGIQNFAAEILKLKAAWDSLDPSIQKIIILLGAAGFIGLITGNTGIVIAIGILILGIYGLINVFDKDLTTSIKGLIALLGVAGLVGILTGSLGVAGAIAGVSLAFFGLNELINGDVSEAIEGLILLLGGAGLAGAFIGGLKGASVGVAIASVILILRSFSDLLSGDTTREIKGFIELVTGTAGLIVTLNLIRGGAITGLLGIVTPLTIVAAGFAALAAGIYLVSKNWKDMNGLERTISILGLIAIAAATAAGAIGALQSAWSLGLAAAAIVAGTAAIGYSISQANKRAQENIPKLAVGGIVNNPGKGVPVGGAIAGEAGREGVIPLTDSTAMMQLGQEIGKWITVNVLNNTYLDSRVIQRKTEQRRNELAFATNGRI